MRRPLAALFLLIFAGLVLGAFAFLRSQAAADLLCAQVEARGGEAIGGTVLVGRCEMDPLAIELAFHDVAIRVPRRGLEVEFDRLTLKLRELQAPSQQILVDALVLRRPRITVDLDRWTRVTPAKGTAWDGCSLPRLPLRVIRGDIRDAEFTIIRDGERVFSVSDLAFTTQGWGQSLSTEILSARGELHLGGRVLSFSKVTADAELQSDGMVLVARSLKAQVGNLRARMTRSSFSLCELSGPWGMEVSGEVSEWLRLLGTHRRFAATGRGQLELRVSGGGSILHPEIGIVARFHEAAVDGYRLGNAEVVAALDGTTVQIDRIRTDSMKGELTLGGEVALLPPHRASLHLKVHDGSIEALVDSLGTPAAWSDGTVSGAVSLEGTLVPFEMSGFADLEVVDFVTLGRPVRDGPASREAQILALPPASVKATLGVNTEKISIERGSITLPGSTVLLRGDFPLSGEASVAVTASAEPIDLGQDIPWIAGMPYRGIVRGPFTLSGPYGDLIVEGQLVGRGFAVEGIEAGVVTGHLRYAEEKIKIEGAAGQRGRTQYVLNTAEILLNPDPVDFVFDVEVLEGRVEDIVMALERWHPLAHRLRGATGKVRAAIHVTGPSETASVDLEGRIKNASFKGQTVAGLDFQLQMEERRRLRIDEVRLRLREDDLTTLRGFAEFDGELGLSISTRETPLDAFSLLLDTGLAGRASGDLVVSGSWQLPRASGALVIEGLTTRDTPQGDARIQITLKGKSLGLRGGLADGRVSGVLGIELGREGLSLELVWNEPRISRWFSLLPNKKALLDAWDGHSVGALTFLGNPRQSETWSGQVQLKEARAETEGLGMELLGGTEIEIRHGIISSRGLTVSSGASQLHLRGRAGAKMGLDLSLDGALDLQALAVASSAVDSASGTLDLKANIGGPIDRPTLVGSARLHDGRIVSSALPFELDSLGGELTFSQRAVVFDGVTGIAGRGRIELSGAVRLEKLLPSRFHLITRLDDVRIAPADGLSLTLAGALYLDGRADELFLSGNLQTVRGRYEAELGIDGLLPWARSRKASFSDPDAQEIPLRLDVTLSVPGTMVIATPELDARLQGELRVLGPVNAPGVLGTLDALEGEAKFRGNRYRITHAVVDFHSPDRIDPTFDVNAEADVRDYRVLVHAFGSPEEPRLVLNSDPVLAEADLLTLLTLGLTARDAEGLARGEAAFAVMDALFAATGLDRQVNRFLPDNEILRAPRLRLTSGYSRRSGQVEPRVAFESRLFTDALRLRYSAPIGSAGQRASAEVRITDTISAQAEWDTEYRESEVGNLGVDLKLRWELE